MCFTICIYLSKVVVCFTISIYLSKVAVCFTISIYLSKVVVCITISIYLSKVVVSTYSIILTRLVNVEIRYNSRIYYLWEKCISKPGQFNRTCLDWPSYAPYYKLISCFSISIIDKMRLGRHKNVFCDKNTCSSFSCCYFREKIFIAPSGVQKERIQVKLLLPHTYFV